MQKRKMLGNLELGKQRLEPLKRVGVPCRRGAGKGGQLANGLGFPGLIFGQD